MTSLSHLARIAGLSPSRFMHAFTESTGIPLRPYLRLLRVRRAIAALHAGRTVTESAHRAGFSDAAHLTRSVGRTFGVTPSTLVHQEIRRTSPLDEAELVEDGPT